MLTTPWADRIFHVFDAMPYLMAIINSEGSVVHLNKAMLNLMGLTREDINGRPYWELDCWLHSEEVQNRVLFAMEYSAINDTEVTMESHFKAFNGEIQDIDFYIKALHDEQLHETYFLATAFNVTALVFSRGALTEKERQMQALFDYSEEGFFMNVLPEGLKPEVPSGASASKKSLEDCLIDDFITYQKVERTNKAFREIFGYEPEEAFETNRLYELIKVFGRSYRDLMTRLLIDGEVKIEYAIVDRKGKERILQLFMVLIAQQGYYYGNFGVIKDLTMQRAYERELEFYAFRDPLTGLNNRRTFFKKTREYFMDDSHCGMVIMCDIDHFKSVNDTYGHAIGDQVLIGFSKQLLSVESDNVLIARYGGEEFVVLLKSFDIDAAERWSQKLLELARFNAYTSENGDVFHITISIGVAEIWHSDTLIDSTITRADKALYDAKQSGRNRYTCCKLSPLDVDAKTVVSG